MKKGLISKLLTALLLVGLLFSILPSQQAQAQGATITVCASDCNYVTIKEGIAAAQDGDTIQLGAGVFNSSVTKIDKAITLRGAENYASQVKAVFNVGVSNVTIEGLDLSMIGYPTVINLSADQDGGWRDDQLENVKILNNKIHDVGQTGGNVKVIKGAHGPDNITIEGNHFYDITNGTASGSRHVSVVDFGDSTILNPSEGIVIRNNIFEKISGQKNEIFAILFSNGAGVSGTIEGNTFNLDTITAGSAASALGAISQQNALASPGELLIKNNTFNVVDQTKISSKMRVISIANSITTITHNKFLGSGHRKVAGVSSVNAQNNWWGRSTGPVSGEVSGTSNYTPWCINEHCTIPPVKNETQVTYFDTIQAAINDAADNDVITVAEGTYVEDLVVNRPITLTGAGMDLTTVVSTTGNTTTLTFATDGATVQGFHFTHEYTPEELADWNFNNNSVTVAQGRTGNTLKNSKVTLGRNGIYLNNAQGNIFEGNLVENNRTGFNLTNTVDGTQLLNNTIKENWTLGIVYYSQGQMTDFDTVSISGNSFLDNWYSEILIKDAQVSAGTLNVTGNAFSDNPVTITNNADAKWNEPGFAALKPLSLGGTAVAPTTPWPTLRIYNSPDVTLVHEQQVPVDFTSIQGAINAAGTGATIMVGPGVYNENLTINKAITLQGPGFVETFDDAIDLVEWYIDRKAPGVFANGTFQGENVLHHGIRAIDEMPDSFRNSQGRKYDINLSGPNQIVSIDLFVGEDWNTEERGPGMWATGFDADNVVSAYPIVAFRHSSVEAPGFYAFDYIDGGWKLLRAAKASDYGRWHTMEFELIAGVGVKHYIDGEMLLSFADPDTRSIGNVILNASNFGEDYDIYWDNFGAHDARINGQIDVNAGAVNLNGLMLSNSGQPQAVVIYSTANGVSLSENLILEVGGKEYGDKVQAVYLQGGPDNVKFEDNLFTRIHAKDKSVNGIYSGDTLSTDEAEGLIIKNTRFVNITSATKGAYGILLNNAAGNPGAAIQGNLFSTVAGGWTHAIGMEGPTPNAIISKNIFNELAYGDAHAAIFFEANPDYGTTQIFSNQFLSKEYFAVDVHPSMTDVEPIDVARNWWGKTSGPEFPLQLNNPINFGYYPWCLNAECTEFSAEPEVGFELTEVPGACSATNQTIEIKATDLVNLSAYTMAFDYNPALVEIVKVENVSGLAGVVKTDTNDTTAGKYVFEFYRNDGSPISGESGLIKITYKSKLLAGNAEFTLDAANSMLVQWPNVNPIPFTVSNPTTTVSYPLVATITSRTPNVGYCTLPAAIEAAASGETVRAEVNVAIPPQTIEKELTLNTNGMTISRDPAFTVGNNFFTVQNGGKLTLTGAGTISTTLHTAVLVQGSLGNETLLTNNDVTILGPYFSVAVNANRTPSSDIYPAKYVMLGGKTQDTVIVQGKGAELDLRGGKMFGVPPVMGNGTVDATTDNSGTVIRISGTVEIDGTAINPLSPGLYHPQYGELYISGGTIKGYNGVEMKAGTLTMTGGKIQGVGAFVEDPERTGNGTTPTGDGLLVYSRNGYSTNNLMNINISGGEISSTNAYAIREFNHSDEANRIDKFSISGGTFIGNANLDAVLFTVADPDHNKLALTAGAYNSDPVVYVYSPLATYLDTDNLYRITTQPTITAEPFAAYYLTGDENLFKATLTNPAGAASYAHAMVKLTIPGATDADLAKIQFIEPAGLATIAWKQVGDDLVGWYGGVAIGGVPLPAGASVDRDIKIKFNEAGIYTLKSELYQMDGTIATDGDFAPHAISKLTEASFSVTVYNTPVITTTLVGPYHAGEAANVTINVNNVDAIFTPDKTELHLDLPEGTIVVYNGVTYTCTATGCVIPVTLAEGANALAVTITFPGAFEDEITIGLFDKSVIPGKQLATFETPAVVSVYGNVGTFTGTVSMQGQLTNRKNVPMTLTGPDAFGFGPYDAISDSRGKLTFSNLAVGSYFVTTAQPRYLNLYMGTLPTEQWIVNLSTLTSLPELWLRGGNAVWTDNLIDVNDANRVGSDWGIPVVADTDGDVNFDGIVNIQDIALVGGNFDLTSAIAYADWLK